MKRVLLAVEDSKASLRAVDLFHELFEGHSPETTILLYVEKIEGASFMDEMLGEAELSTLKKELEGTRYQEMLDSRAKKVLEYFRRHLEEKGVSGIQTAVREGHPAEEILAVAKEEDVRLIIVGARSRRARGLFMGSVGREVANRSERPVLIARGPVMDKDES